MALARERSVVLVDHHATRRIQVHAIPVPVLARREEIALGLHSSVVRRVTGMVGRVAAAGDIVFTGGVAKNPCMRSLLARPLGRRILLPAEPQLAGALGAALLAMESE